MGERRRYRSFGIDNIRWQGVTLRPDDIIISTPAKSGTTWMQMMCALLVFQETTFDRPLTQISPWVDNQTEALDSVMATLDAQQHRRFIKSHTPYDGLPHDPDVKYICVGRDPRDVAISWTHHEANMNLEKFINGRIEAVGIDDLDEFEPFVPPPTDPRERFWYWVDEPAEKIMSFSLATTLYHLSTFWAERDNDNFILFHYNDLSHDLDGEMRRLAEFLEIDVPETKWNQLVEAATFASMQQRSKDLAPEVTKGFWNDVGSFFRRGSSGEWREFIDGEDAAAHYESRVAELAGPDLARWVHTGWAGYRADLTSVQ